jgi:ethanolaminephosphotransferase
MARFLVVANVAIPLAVLIFAAGFFPYKPLMPGLAAHADYAAHGDPPAAQFDKLIFMVVDALRSDFVFSGGSGFTFTQK